MLLAGTVRDEYQTVRARSLRPASPRGVRQLLSSRALTLDVALPRNHASASMSGPQRRRLGARERSHGSVDHDSPRRLEALSQSLPSRDGLEHSFELANGGSVLVSFEVDVVRGRERKNRESGKWFRREESASDHSLIHSLVPSFPYSHSPFARDRPVPDVAAELNTVPVDAVGECVGVAAVIRSLIYRGQPRTGRGRR